jgi:glucan phosphoethanolaminetransferase (alkaline phosphatase superfamily)
LRWASSPCAVNPKRKNWGKIEHLCLVIGVATFFVAPIQNLAWGGVFKLKDTGYPVFRFVKDVVVNNQEVVDEQARMAELSNMKDTWNVLAVKPKYHTYVVVIGESARRDAMGAFGGHWDNTPFASSVNGTLFTDYIAASGSTQKSLGLTLNRVVDGKPQYQDNFVTWLTAPVSRPGGSLIRGRLASTIRQSPALQSVLMKFSS